MIRIKNPMDAYPRITQVHDKEFIVCYEGDIIIYSEKDFKEEFTEYNSHEDNDE